MLLRVIITPPVICADRTQDVISPITLTKGTVVKWVCNINPYVYKVLYMVVIILLWILILKLCPIQN